MKKEYIRDPGSTHPLPRAIKVGNWIFTALTKPGPSFEEQLTGILEEIKTTLEGLGSSMGDIVQMTVYFVNLGRDYEKTIPIWRKYMPRDKWPMAAWIGVSELVPGEPPLEPPLQVEIACSAIVPDE